MALILTEGCLPRTATPALAAALLLAPVLASGQQAFQPPPDAFQTPSGNVHCRWAGGTLACIAERTAVPPAESRRCPAAWPGWLALRPEGAAEAACTGAGRPSEEDFVLGYGARWIAHGITCDSAETGLTCTNRSGHGFRASRARVELF